MIDSNELIVLPIYSNNTWFHGNYTSHTIIQWQLEIVITGMNSYY